MFSGYVKRHEIKVLTMNFLNGVTGYIYGPISGHKNNIAALNMSWVNTQLLLLQAYVTQAIANGEIGKVFCIILRQRFSLPLMYYA